MANALKKSLLWFDLPKQWTILQQLQFEETVLRCSTKNCFMFKHGTPQPVIVMGFSAKPAELLNIEAVQKDNIMVLRRYTGGGTVIVDNQSVFTSWIMNSKDADSAPYPREIMKWSETIFKPVFDSCIDSSTGDSFLLREHDYVVGDKKIGGNAQTITKDRWVHHTSFLWDFDNKNMGYLQLPKKRPEYRQSRDHNDFLRKLQPIMKGNVGFFRSQLLEKAIELYNIEVISNEHDIESFRESVIAEKPGALEIRTKIETL
jgi:lipoate-protein ligase A